jgi:hypothetical protein
MSPVQEVQWVLPGILGSSSSSASQQNKEKEALSQNKLKLRNRKKDHNIIPESFSIQNDR